MNKIGLKGFCRILYIEKDNMTGIAFIIGIGLGLFGWFIYTRLKEFGCDSEKRKEMGK